MSLERDPSARVLGDRVSNPSSSRRLNVRRIVRWERLASAANVRCEGQHFMLSSA